MTRPSFLIYKSFYEPIKHLSLEEKGMLFDCIFQYHNNQENPVGYLEPNNNFNENLQKLPPQVLMAFSFFRNQFDLDEGKYQNIVNRNKSNGSKGGRPKKEETQDNQENPVGYLEPKKADKEKEKEKDIKKDKPNGLSKKSQKQKSEKFTPPTLEEIQSYCRERKNGVDAKKFLDYYQSGNWTGSDGKAVKNWKQRMIANWENKTNPTASTTDNTVLTQEINKLANEQLVKQIETNGSKALIYVFSDKHHEKLTTLPENLKTQIKQKIHSTLGTTGVEVKF